MRPTNTVHPYFRTATDDDSQDGDGRLSRGGTMDGPSHARFVKRSYFAEEDITRNRYPKWRIFAQADSTDPTSDALPVFSPSDYWNKPEAQLIAHALNQALDDFIGHNDISALNRPLLKRRIDDPNDPTIDTLPTDHLARWLTATDILPEEWTGSLLSEIIHVRNTVVNLLENAGNVEAHKSSDGNWRIFTKSKK
jgi:hypothetical protein